MANEEKKIWGIHTTDDFLFLHNDVIAIGWQDFGDYGKLEPSREAYKAHYIDTYPDSKKGAIATSAGMLYRFAVEVKIGDYVVFPSKADRKINIGVVESDFIYNSEAAPYVQQRKVKWLKHLPRTAFSQGALYEVGSARPSFCSRTTLTNTCRLWIKASSLRQPWQSRTKPWQLPQKILLKPPETSF